MRVCAERVRVTHASQREKTKGGRGEHVCMTICVAAPVCVGDQTKGRGGKAVCTKSALGNCSAYSAALLHWCTGCA